jgi:hypothetical protein
MQLMEITENDRDVVRSSVLESFGIKPRTKIAIVPIPLMRVRRDWLRTLTRKRKGIAERGAPAMP